MAFRSRHPVAQAAERFTCPRCGAAPGQQCHATTGNPAPYPHTGRVYLIDRERRNADAARRAALIARATDHA